MSLLPSGGDRGFEMCNFVMATTDDAVRCDTDNGKLTGFNDVHL
jgi:hypothetical protein